MELYYDWPLQVRYIRTDGIKRLGIAFHEFVIDIDDGRIFRTKDIIKFAQCDPDDAIIEWSDWKPLKM